MEKILTFNPVLRIWFSSIGKLLPFFSYKKRSLSSQVIGSNSILLSSDENWSPSDFCSVAV